MIHTDDRHDTHHRHHTHDRLHTDDVITRTTVITQTTSSHRRLIDERLFVSRLGDFVQALADEEYAGVFVAQLEVLLQHVGLGREERVAQAADVVEVQLEWRKEKKKNERTSQDLYT